MFNPIRHLYEANKAHINDMGVTLFMYTFIYLGDAALYTSGRNLPLIGLSLAGFGYLSLRFIIRKFKKQDSFGSFANGSVQYTMIIAIMIYVFYYIFIRSQKFPPTRVFGDFKL